MNWRKLTMREALAYGRSRTETGDYGGACGWPRGCNPNATAGVVFGDGTVLVGESMPGGPLSEVTPDWNFEPPQFWLGVPEGRVP